MKAAAVFVNPNAASYTAILAGYRYVNNGRIRRHLTLRSHRLGRTRFTTESAALVVLPPGMPGRF